MSTERSYEIYDLVDLTNAQIADGVEIQPNKAHAVAIDVLPSGVVGVVDAVAIDSDDDGDWSHYRAADGEFWRTEEEAARDAHQVMRQRHDEETA